MNTAELGTVAEISGGWTTSAAALGDIRLVRTTDIVTGDINWSTVPYCEDSPAQPHYVLRHGDILVARTGVGSVGNVALVADPPRSVAASYLLRIRPSDDIDSAYLLWYLRTSAGRAQLAARAVGSVIPNLSAKRISTVEVPLEKLSDQLAKASAIAQADRAYRAANDSLRHASEELRGLRRNTWPIAVAELRSGDSEWPLRALASIVTIRDSARIPLNAAARASRIGPTPYYGASGVIDHVEGFTHEGEFLLLSEDGQNLESRNQDIAMVSTGKIWANNHIHVLEPGVTVLPAFLAAYINGLDLRDFLTGTTQPKLPQVRMRDIQIPVPPLDVQAKIVAVVEQLTATLDSWIDDLGSAAAALTRAWNAFIDRMYGVETASSTFEAVEVPTEREEHAMRKLEYPSIEVALRAHPEGLSPEALFSTAGSEGADAQERVDYFYEELRSLMAAERVQEKREGDRIMLVWT